MTHVDVLIGNKLPLYREVLASTFRALRPDLVVHAVTDEDLDTSVTSLQPWLVICSVVTETIKDLCPSWIVVFPDERDEAIVTIAGQSRTIPHAGVRELLAVLAEIRPPEAIHPNG